MIQQHYKRPPITEAVIEICFTSPHDQSNFTKAIYDTLSASIELPISKYAFSDNTRKVMKAINDLKNQSAHALLTNYQPVLPKDVSIDEYLFDACANIKIMTSRVVMHRGFSRTKMAIL